MTRILQLQGVLFAVAVVGLFPKVLLAQDSLKSYVMEDVVITGQFEPQSAAKSVYQVRTIPLERIQSQGANRLQDVLQTELNMRFTQDLALGESSMTLQGLGGQNIKVLVDGMPLITREGTSNSSALNQIDVNNIERIEIVEGPMSVVYGADALAGVINIITKKPGKQKWNVSGRLQEESVGSEYAVDKGIHNQSLSGGYSQGKFYGQGTLSRNKFSGWQGNAQGRDKQWHPKSQWLTGALAGFKTEDTHLFYKLDYLDESIANPGQFNGGQALDQEYITRRLNQQVQVSKTFFSKIDYNGAFSITDFRRRTLSTTVDQATGDVRLALGAGVQDVSSYRGLSFRGTFHYELNSRWSFQPGYDVNLEEGEGGRIDPASPWLNDFAGFLSVEYKPTEKIGIRPGVRVVRNSVYQAPPAIPSINTKFQLSGNVVMRAAYARGFRSPSLRELYFSFFDASHSIEGNPELGAELSHSVNGSVSWKALRLENSFLEITGSGFYNTVENMISLGQKPGDNLVTTYINIDRFKTKGINWNNTYRAKTYEIKAGFSYVGRFNQLYESGTELPEFTWTPEANLISTVFLSSIDLNLNLYYKYTGSLPNYEVFQTDSGEEIRLTRIEGYHMADLTAQKGFKNSLKLSAGIKNLFNVTNVNNSSATTGGAHSTAGPRPIGYGRSWFLGLMFNLGK